MAAVAVVQVTVAAGGGHLVGEVVIKVPLAVVGDIAAGIVAVAAVEVVTGTALCPVTLVKRLLTL